MKALVTGGAGFIGSHLVGKLMEKYFEVIVLDNFFTGNIENLRLYKKKCNFRLVKGDVRNRADVREAIKDVDYVFHLAAIVSVDFSIENPRLANEVNVDGTLNVLEESLKVDVKRFVYTSSCAVYGEPIKLPISEEHPTKPLSPYGISKLAAEQYCRIFYNIYGLKTICLRLFNVYGPRQKVSPYSGVITQFIEKLRKKQSPVIFGDGNQTRDFIYVDDVIDAVMLTLENEDCVGEIINIGSGKETSINELAKVLIKILGFKNLRPKYAEARVGDIRRSCACVDKAERLLDFKPKFSLEEGIKKLLVSEMKHEYNQ